MTSTTPMNEPHGYKDPKPTSKIETILESQKSSLIKKV
jgi:hypothetical protein